MSCLTARNAKLFHVIPALALAVAALALRVPPALAADHGDAPSNANDRAADLGDSFLFLDPNDNGKLILAMTVQGFIVPGEAVNFGFFDGSVRYRFELETTGDAVPDEFIDVTFSEKSVSGANPQVATVRSTFFRSFTGLTTVANLSPNSAAPGITTDPASGISVFAGIVDDPFTFDIPAFSRFVASVNAGAPNPAVFERGRDTFAGYNTLAIALSIPVERIRQVLARGVHVVGLNSRTSRPQNSGIEKGRTKYNSPSGNIDRAGNPAVNVALIPYPRKNEFNLSSTEDDASGKFASDIVATLRRFGTNDTNIAILAGVAVAHGDFLHLDLRVSNSGGGGGINAGAGFPNGRRLGDDVIDTILFFVANQTPLTDNANANDVPLRDAFPFFAPPHQPFEPGTLDDRTRN